MGDVHGSSVLGVNYPRRKLSVCNYVGAIFLGGNSAGVKGPESTCLRGNCPGDNCPRWELSVGGDCPGGNCPIW